mgnify:FL=1
MLEYTAILNNDDYSGLIDFQEKAPYAQIAHPTLEHFIPLLYIAGTKFSDESSLFPYEGFSHGSLSMRNWLVQ